MTTVDVLVIGEALIDIVRTPDGAVEHVGGSPANVALGLGRRGIDVALLTQIGADDRAAMIQEHLRRSGVTVRDESVSLARTSTAVAHLGPDGSASYDFDIVWDSFPEPEGLRSRILHTGSIAAFLAPGDDSVRAILRSADAGLVTFDPNIRPALVGDHVRALALFEETCRLAHVVKMSDEDAAWLLPDRTPEQAVDAVLAWGPSLVVVTLGSDGALLGGGDIRVHVPAVRVSAVDTIGAGDTFMASLLVSLARDGMPRTEAEIAAMGGRAVRAAAITVSRAGADLPWAAELED
ncbi:carbohydrate kinase [Microbacterium sp. NPDC089189]|uniref:carbohydrate kinase family protein n=1 Tax=Microbacterium sp. NPDC089189 TaxID=3154972 RepID=UPI00341424BA